MSHPLPSTTTSTTTTSSAGCSPFPSSHSKKVVNYLIDEVLDLYKEAIGIPSQIVMRQIRKDITELNIPTAYYKYAITQTAYAPRPSMAYCQAIIRRLCRERVPPEDLIDSY